MFDARCRGAVLFNSNMLVPWFLMASYAYYEEDDPILSDEMFDMLGKEIAKQWDEIDHHHKHLIDRTATNTGHYIEYPTIVKYALVSLREENGNEKRGKRKGKA